MIKLIDIHSHILPLIDDGSGSEEESRHMLEIAHDEGISIIFCTPHNHPKKGHASAELIQKSVKKLQPVASQYDIKLVAGNEIYYTAETPERLKQGEYIPIDGANTVLVEFNYTAPYHHIRNAVTQIQMAGYDVLMAHCERYQALLSDFDAVYDLDNLDVLFQVNADSITGEMGNTVKRFVKKLLSSGLVYCVGTDAHSESGRTPKMAKAYKYVSGKFGQEYADAIFAENAKKLIL